MDEEEVNNQLHDLIQRTWDKVSRVRRSPTENDCLEAKRLASQIDSVIRRYKESSGEFLSDTTLWLAQEIIATVRDVTNTVRI